MFEVGLNSVCAEINEAFSKDNLQRVDSLLWPALDQFSDLPQLWFYAGNLAFKLGKSALAALCFERANELDENPLVLANLGAAYRRLNEQDKGLAALGKALERNPNYEPALVNYGAMFVNEGRPNEGIPALERAVALGRARGKLETGASWNLGLLYLEAARFAEGFDIYRAGCGAERMMRNYAYSGSPEPKRLEPEDHAATIASGTRPTLIVWGEQGIGDELMFATCLNDASEHYEIIFECHPRLERLHRNSTWAHKMADEGRAVRIYPTRKDEHIGWPVTESVRADFKCPVGDLAALYRREAESFRAAWRRFGPTYHVHQREAIAYRGVLEQMAQGRPIVGLAMHGGVMTTAREYRTMRVPELEHLIGKTDCLFVGLDYDDMTPVVLHIHEKFGADRYFWPTAITQHWDYEHMAALLAATDLNVLVCQSAAHLSAGIGAETRVLVPKRCAWRYAPIDADNTWYWNPGEHAQLYRQAQPDNWQAPLDAVIADITRLQNSRVA